MTKRASEMPLEQIESIVENMDWTEIHKARVFSDYGDSVVLYTDGTFSVQDQGTYYRDPDAAGVIGYLNCWGRGNIDRADYFEGFAERVEDGEHEGMYDICGDHPAAEPWLVDEDEALRIAIEQGDWDYREDIDEFMSRYEEETVPLHEEARMRAEAEAEWRRIRYQPETYGMEDERA